MKEHLPFMQMALNLAKQAAAQDEVPIGALIINDKNEVLAQSANSKEKDHNPLAHAEIKSILAAAKKQNAWRLENCTLYVTLEPCPMCLAALREARISKCIFGAYDAKGGALSLGYRLHQDLRLNHRFSVIGGIMQNEAASLLSSFFRQKRQA